MENNKVVKDEGKLIFKCPHCNDFVLVIIKEINCRIFRHGIYKSNMKQVNPHAPKTECDSLVERKLVYGCCKPFRLIPHGDEFTVEKCEYL